MFRAAALALALLAAIAGVAHAQTVDGRLKRIADTRTLNVAYRSDAAPFSFVDDNKQISGYSIDLCKRVVESIGGSSPDRAEGEPGAGHRADALRRDRQGRRRHGVRPPSTVTLSRMQRVDFSSYIFLETTACWCAPAPARARSPRWGKKIAVIAGTPTSARPGAGLQPEDRRRRRAGKDATEGLAALLEGRVDAFASDKLLLVGDALRAKDPNSLSLLTKTCRSSPTASCCRAARLAAAGREHGAGADLPQPRDRRDLRGAGSARSAPVAGAEAVFLLGAIPD